jgi:hypothetical protein
MWKKGQRGSDPIVGRLHGRRVRRAGRQGITVEGMGKTGYKLVVFNNEIIYSMSETLLPLIVNSKMMVEDEWSVRSHHNALPPHAS